MDIGFDVISDLNLSPNDSFNWENKATSLYCIIAGNVSNDLRTIYQTFLHLSRFYHAILYTPGTLEYTNVKDHKIRTIELGKICNSVKNVTFMHHHVVILDGIAIVGANGWYGAKSEDLIVNSVYEYLRYEDVSYLCSTLEKVTLHMDVKKVMVMSHSVPNYRLYFGEQPPETTDNISLSTSLEGDTQHKVSYWVYGSYEKHVDIVMDDIRYVNNSYYKRNPYYAKNLIVTL
jgi:hypothetical protein